MADETIWGIHAGRTGNADSLFQQKSVIAIGWEEFGDLSSYATRDDYKRHYAEIYPQAKSAAIPVSAGQLYRFVHEVKVGDLVVYPAKSPQEIRIGRVAGDYQYRPEVDQNYPNQRAVAWLHVLPRTKFTQGALYEIGSAMSLFQVTTYADEFRSAITGTIVAPPDHKDTVAVVTSEIEQQTRDFVLKRLSQDLKGIPLEEFIAHLLERMGYRSRLTPVNEPSVDIIAHRDELGFEPPLIRVQVKSGDGKVSDRDVSALYGKVSQGEFGLLVTLGSFTPPAVQFAGTKSNLRLIDGNELVDLVFQQYESFDSRYKSLLPLKRVYVPEALALEE